MSLKNIYFVRHGQTVLNKNGIRQGADGSLTELGRNQSYEAAEELLRRKVNFGVLISSPFERTKETSAIITEKIKVPIEYSELFVERRNPSEIIGHEKNETEVRMIVDKIDKGFHSDDLKHSDEENFLEFKNRAKKALKYLRRRKEKNLIVVTHSLFLKMLMAYILMGDKLTAVDYVKLRYFDTINNAALTICTCKTHWFSKTEWDIIVWNNQVV